MVKLKLEDKLNSLIKLSGVCIISERKIYEAIREEYNLSHKEMKYQWLTAQNDFHIEYKNRKLYIE